MNDLQFETFCLQNLGMPPGTVRRRIESWLEEDSGSGDLTLRQMGGLSAGLCHAQIVAKQECVLAGVLLAVETFRIAHGAVGPYSPFRVIDSRLDGEKVAKDTVVLEMEGLASALLLGERSALNLFAKLSGIASQTERIASGLKKAAGDGRCPYLLETRKTTPGLRVFEKFATRVGGAMNHRMNLDSGAMLKENHFFAANQNGSDFGAAIGKVQSSLPMLSSLEVEVTNFQEFEIALAHQVPVIMLDNFTPADMKRALALRNEIKSNSKIEISGNLDQMSPESVVASGADYVSMGALIHQAKWVDLSLRFINRV